MTNPIPPLEPHCNSWVISDRETGIAVCELYNPKLVAKVDQDRHLIETAATYLARINGEIKNGSTLYNTKETAL